VTIEAQQDRATYEAPNMMNTNSCPLERLWRNCWPAEKGYFWEKLQPALLNWPLYKTVLIETLWSKWRQGRCRGLGPVGHGWPTHNFVWVGHNAFGRTNNWPVCSL